MTMLGRMIGATATSVLARQLGAGPAGMALGLALPFVARRLGPLGMVSMAIGAWALARIVKDSPAASPGASIDVPVTAPADVPR